MTLELNVLEKHILEELLAIRQKQEEIFAKLEQMARIDERQKAHKDDLDRAFVDIRASSSHVDEIEKRVETLETQQATEKPFWKLVWIAAAGVCGAIVTKYLETH